METYVFDIARGSTQDGPGMRTVVFLKGCPLRCAWCHNPESQSPTPQLSFTERSCCGCRRCVAVCPSGAQTVTDGKHTVDFTRCTACGKCVAVCPAEALKIFGEAMTPADVWAVIERDIPFYRYSGGGVTLSGGEPLMHVEFGTELLSLCRENGVHTCIETSGMGTWQALERYLPLTDCFLFDWKVATDEAAQEHLGAPLGKIRSNLCRLLDSGANMILRCPIIPNVNDTAMHFESIAALLENYSTLTAELLPYHDFGVGKSTQIGRTSPKFITPAKEQKEQWLAFFRSRYGERVRIQ